MKLPQSRVPWLGCSRSVPRSSSDPKQWRHYISSPEEKGPSRASPNYEIPTAPQPEAGKEEAAENSLREAFELAERLPEKRSRRTTRATRAVYPRVARLYTFI